MTLHGTHRFYKLFLLKVKENGNFKKKGGKEIIVFLEVVNDTAERKDSN